MKLSITLLILISSFCAYYTFDKKLSTNGDNAYYFTLGKSIAQGTGYRNIYHPSPKINRQYPPGVPMLCAVNIWLFGAKRAVYTTKITISLFYVAAVILAFLLFCRLSIGIWIPFCSAVGMAVNPLLLVSASTIMTEIPYITALLLCCLLLDYRSPAWAAVAALCACMFRAQGVVLVIALVLYLAMANRFRAAVLAAIIIFAGLGAWKSYVGFDDEKNRAYTMANVYRPELGQATLKDKIVRAKDNTVRYINTEIPGAMLPFAPGRPVRMGWLFTIPFILLVVYELIYQKYIALFLAMYIAGTFGVCLLWPTVWTGPRFMSSTVPLLLFLALGSINRLTHGKGWPVIAWALLVYLVPLRDLHARANLGYPPDWEGYLQMARWARDNTPKDAVFVARKPVLFYLESGRNAFKYQFDRPDAVYQDMEYNGATHVVLDNLKYNSTRRYLRPAVAKYANKYKPVAYNKFEPRTVIIQKKPKWIEGMNK